MSRIAKAAAITAAAGAILATGAGIAAADADAHGAAIGSPGVLSGNLVQAPIHVPINVCGNTVNAPGVLNPAFGNVCQNISSDDDDHSDHKSDNKGDNKGDWAGHDSYNR
ncbi:chaplin [Streptomyces sp. PH10-H1]|uniref:chaplin n=1 Tax=Streptomyces sp. PH10-H1 TaxID=3046212 RepID=UPI0024BB98A6|nr:chaplin [Streptomyces sp. PH10-H1]MDJ0347675.1 chaplin [Streptomyces sp. PH10-H1]